MNDEKRQQRQLKREIKKAGNRKRRQFLKRTLTQDPEGASEVAFDYGRNSSAPLNGIDHDTTRRRRQAESEDD